MGHDKEMSWSSIGTVHMVFAHIPVYHTDRYDRTLN